MKKLILIFIFAFFLFQFIDVNAFECKVKDVCGNDEKTVFYMYDNVDSHVSITNSNWPKKLCCSKDLAGLNDNACNANAKAQLFRIYSSPEGHVSTNPSSSYNIPVCLALSDKALGNVECSLKSSCDANAGEKCIITLSGKDDAHVAECDSAGSYSNKLCCSATVCPKDFVWNPALNNGKGACAFQPQECSNLDKSKGPERFCANIPPYTDTKNSCVRYGPIQYEQACCLAEIYQGNDYYQYQDIGKPRTCTIEQIKNNECFK